MAATGAVWGIDVGQAALKAIKLRAVEGGVEMVAYDVIEHAKILSWADADVETLTRNALEKFVQQNPDVENDPAVVAVPGSLTFSKFVTLPPVEPDKIPDIISFEATQQIPFPISEVVWDYEILTKPDAPEQKAGIFCIKRDDITSVLSHYRNLKPPLNLETVQAAPLALFNFMQYDGQMGEGTTVLLNIGAETSDLIITDGESIVLRNIPLGGNSFTKALVEAFKLPYPKAENLKKTAASSKHAKQIFQAMRPVFADFAGELQRTIARYQAQNRESEITKVVGLGNAFQLPGLQKYLEQNLNVPVVKIEKFDRLRPGPAVNTPKFAENVLSFGVAYGLAVQGLGLARLNSDLLPPEVQADKRWNSKRPWFAAATGLLTAGLSLLVVPRVSETSALEAAVAKEKAIPAGVKAKTDANDKDFNAKKGDPERDRAVAEAVTAPLGQKDISRIIMQDVLAAFEKVNGEERARLRQISGRKTDEVLPLPVPRNTARLVQFQNIYVKQMMMRPAPAAPAGGAPGAAPAPGAPPAPPPVPGMAPGMAPGGAPAEAEPELVLVIEGTTTLGCSIAPEGTPPNHKPQDAKQFLETTLKAALETVDVPGLGRKYANRRRTDFVNKFRRDIEPITQPTMVGNSSVGGRRGGVEEVLRDAGITVVRGTDPTNVPPLPIAPEEVEALRQKWMPVGEYEGDLKFVITLRVHPGDVVEHLNSEVGNVIKPFRLPHDKPAGGPPAGQPAPAPGTPGAPPATPGAPPAPGQPGAPS